MGAAGRRIGRVAILLCVAAVAGERSAAGPRDTPTGPGRIRLEVHEVSLSNGPVEDLLDKSVTVSADRTKVAYARTDPRSKTSRMEINGKAEQSWAGLSPVKFSRDGRRWGYVVQKVRGGPGSVVIDGVATREFDPGVLAGSPAFSSDGKHVLICAKHGEKAIAIYDGVEQKPCDQIWCPTISPDGRHWGYIARTGERFYHVIDGKPQQGFDQMKQVSLIFSPDCRRWAYRGYRGDKQVVVVDGVAGKGYRDTRDPVFSPDSKHYAYWCRTSRGQTCVLDGKEVTGPHYGVSLPVFTSDNRLAYVAGDRKVGCRLVVGGVAGKGVYESHMHQSVTASPAGGRVGFFTTVGKRPMCVVDDKPDRPYDRLIRRIAFSPDGKHYAYRAMRARKWVAVLDGREETPCAAVSRLVWSPDGKHLAYAAQFADGSAAVRDGRPGRQREEILPLTVSFTPDSRHLAYMSGRLGDIRIVVDDIETDLGWEDVAAMSGFHFTGPDSFRVVTVRKKEFFRVDVTIRHLHTTATRPSHTEGRKKTHPGKAVKERPEQPLPGASKDRALRECRQWLNLARNYIDNGMVEKARPYLQRVISRQGDGPLGRKARDLLAEIEKSPE